MRNREVTESALRIVTPKPFGRESNARLVKYEMFSISRSNDGDIWPEITSITLNEDLPLGGEDRFFKKRGGRVRTPFIGGGASNKMFDALLDLMMVMARDSIFCANGAQGFLPFKPNPLPLKAYIERRLDDGGGYLGMEITQGGVARLHMWPMEEERESRLNQPASIAIPANTPYQLTYAFLPRLYAAIKEDNRELGAFAGNHAY